MISAEELAAIAAALKAVEGEPRVDSFEESVWKLSDRFPDLTIEELRAGVTDS